jgi:hypothetical protein
MRAEDRMIQPFVSEADSEPLVFQVCAAILNGRVVQRCAADGRHLSVGPYRRADGVVRFALLFWSHGGEEIVGDAYDVATAFVAQLSAETTRELHRELTGECPTERLLPVAARVRA